MFNFSLDPGSHSAKTNSLNSNLQIIGNRWKPEQTMLIHIAPNDSIRGTDYWQSYAPVRCAHSSLEKHYEYLHAALEERYEGLKGGGE